MENDKVVSGSVRKCQLVGGIDEHGVTWARSKSVPAGSIRNVTRRSDGSRRVSKRFVGESATQQQFREESSVSNVVAKYTGFKNPQLSEAAVRTIIMRHAASRPGEFKDLTVLPDFADALNTIAKGKSSFEALPSQVRARFKNDPREFLLFLQNPENIDELVKLGVVEVRGKAKGKKSAQPSNTVLSGDSAPEKK